MHLVKQVGYVDVNVKASTDFSVLLAKTSTNSEFNGPKESCGTLLLPKRGSLKPGSEAGS